ncbi:sulfurtransferase complex subunit TusB [Siccibacter colletis]|jgi:tRNA 2-thiouridine synthesizing protein B|uniref:sulfurtransferase complex subunit TusB n=1 Tax=Siccibacter colletis TaxID=1505757 RepID=UPI0004E1B512|nr:sulfurtransferase complex subunit TusB [Siccibacter colletis]WNN48850.1 sulfurtransferase complex subunit TusB [Siccibacter colletis]
MLHTLSHSPWHCDFSTFLSALQPGDEVLLLQDGVIAAIEGGLFLEKLRSAPISVSVLRDDVEARGLSAQISNSIVRVSYTDFVRMTLSHQSQMAW